MTDEQIKEALGKLIGWHKGDEPLKNWYDDKESRAASMDWNPLANIADTWIVLGEIAKNKPNLTQAVADELSHYLYRYEPIGWAYIHHPIHWFLFGGIAPRAISLAVLKAAGVEVS